MSPFDTQGDQRAAGGGAENQSSAELLISRLLVDLVDGG